MSGAADGGAIAAVATVDSPLPLTKAVKAAWKRALKQLKLKDVGKKVEGIRYCAEDSRFFREGGGLPLLMAFLTRVKVLLHNPGISSCLTALRIFIKLVEFTLQLPPDHAHRSELVANICMRGDPCVQLAAAMTSPNVDLQYASLQALFALASGHPDTDAFIQSLYSTGATEKILSYLMHDEPRFTLLASKYFEHIARFESGRASIVQVNALAGLTTKLQALATSIAADGLDTNAVEVLCQSLELTALTTTRLLVTATALENPDQIHETACHLARALSSPVVKAKCQASSALVMLSSLGRLLERNEDCRTRVKELLFLPHLVHYLVLDENSSAPAGDQVDQQEPMDPKAKPAKGGKPAKESPKKDKEAAPPPVAAVALTDSVSELPPVDAQATARAQATRLTFLNVRNAAEKVLHICAMVDGGASVDGRVFGKPASGGVEPWMPYETFHAVFASSDFSTVLRGGKHAPLPFPAELCMTRVLKHHVVRFAATVLRHRENALRMGVAGTTSLLTILADQAKAQDANDGDTTKQAAFTALVANIAQCLGHLTAASIDICEHSSDGAVETLTPLNFDWGVVDTSIVDLRVPIRMHKPQVLCAQALAGFVRGVLELASTQPKADGEQSELIPLPDSTLQTETVEKGKQPPAKDKKQKDAALLPGEKVAVRVAAFSLQLLQLLATLTDFDLHVEILRIVQAVPSLPNGRKTLLRQAQEQIVLERVPPPADVASAIEALRLTPPEGIAVGAAPFVPPWTEALQAYARLLDPIFHVFHRFDSPVPDILAALKILHGFLFDAKSPQNDYDADLFGNVAVGNGALVVLASLVDLPRLHVAPSGQVDDDALVELLGIVIHHLIQWGSTNQAAVLSRLEAYIAEEEDTSDAAAQALTRTKSIASR
ncbi:hypothetical protein DYB32_001540 [Aphanomyces invadans]|uniref:Uncharacterized protein n=1 Tax=Aphanomyces invadans TaxID=157072 RepID=A0A3R6VRX1_9STRA|nr:hypothetical protein DYB32_001540 [Aphanomyces invadans]